MTYNNKTYNFTLTKYDSGSKYELKQDLTDIL